MAVERLGYIPDHIWTAILAEADQGATPQELLTAWQDTVKQRFGCELTLGEIVDRMLAANPKREMPPSDLEGLQRLVDEFHTGLTDEDWNALPRDASLQLDHYLYGSPRRSE